MYVKMLGSLYHGKDGNILRNNPGFDGAFGPKFNDERTSLSSSDEDDVDIDNTVEESNNDDSGRNIDDDDDDDSGNICRSLDLDGENTPKSPFIVVLL
mmetsp:Transcript_7582/g.18716  ORF Transcript_7582/g.18716 Transcript_7582/m.18716 type:complete len:98 (+) Transcript_7582:617-910(+)